MKLNLVNCTILTATPVLTLYAFMFVPLSLNVFFFSVFYYFFSGIGITAGYHRYWAHRSYEASPLFRLILLVAGSAAMEGSIKWWSRGHRAHHRSIQSKSTDNRYTDTPKDPYTAKKGLFYSHIGWMLIENTNPSEYGKVDISDLRRDPLVTFQHNNYIPYIKSHTQLTRFSIFCTFIIPLLVCGIYFNDWRGGFFWAGAARLLFVHHATFCVNSLAHYLGEPTYDDRNSPRDHFITALVTLGEGYHNFHHEFPNDYRNAIKSYQYDPTKWVIWICSLLGLSKNLKEFSYNEITKGKVRMIEIKLEKIKKTLDYGKPIDSLPSMNWNQFESNVKNGDRLIIIDGVVHDIKGFIDEHPGGKGFLLSNIGRDVTVAFNGGVYYHSNAARNLLASYRVARINDVPLYAKSTEE